MPEFVRVRLDNGAEKNMPKAFAKSRGLNILDKPTTDRLGRPLRTKLRNPLRGAELEAALKDAGLSTSGTADEKRDRLAAHEAADSGTTQKG